MHCGEELSPTLCNLPGLELYYYRSSIDISQSSGSVAVMAAKLMRFAEGQKQMLNSLRQNFSQDTEGSFTNFETVLEGLTTRDIDNKKLVLDQVHEHSVNS